MNESERERVWYEVRYGDVREEYRLLEHARTLFKGIPAKYAPRLVQMPQGIDISALDTTTWYEVGHKHIVRKVDTLADARTEFDRVLKWGPWITEVIQRPDGQLRTQLVTATCDDFGKVTVNEVPFLGRWIPKSPILRGFTREQLDACEDDGLWSPHMPSVEKIIRAEQAHYQEKKKK